MTVPHELVNKAFPAVHDFLNKNYPCECTGRHPDDECPQNSAETAEVIRIVLAAVGTTILAEGWRRGATDLDEPGYYSQADLARMNPYTKETR